MLSPNLASILGYLSSLSRYWAFFVGTLDSCSRFLKRVTFLVETGQSAFAELHPCQKQLEMQWILDSFEKKNRKNNRQWFWDQDQNRKYSIVLNQSISKPDWGMLEKPGSRLLWVLLIIRCRYSSDSDGHGMLTFTW